MFFKRENKNPKPIKNRVYFIKIMYLLFKRGDKFWILKF